MTFEFLLLALIGGQQPIELKKYTEPSVMWCAEDAMRLNEYISNGYYEEPNLDMRKNNFLKSLREYEEQYGKFKFFTDEVLDLDSEAAMEFKYQMDQISDYREYFASELKKGRDASELSEEIRLATSYRFYYDEHLAQIELSYFKTNLDEFDPKTMFKSAEVRYVCLPLPKY